MGNNNLAIYRFDPASQALQPCFRAKDDESYVMQGVDGTPFDKTHLYFQDFLSRNRLICPSCYTPKFQAGAYAGASMQQSPKIENKVEVKPNIVINNGSTLKEKAKYFLAGTLAGIAIGYVGMNYGYTIVTGLASKAAGYIPNPLKFDIGSRIRTFGEYLAGFSLFQNVNEASASSTQPPTNTPTTPTETTLRATTATPTATPATHTHTPTFTAQQEDYPYLDGLPSWQRDNSTSSKPPLILTTTLGAIPGFRRRDR